MTTRRDFLTSFGLALGAIAVVPASALATVQRLGAPREWESDADRFERLARLGRPIVNEHFVLDRDVTAPAGLSLYGVTMVLCRGTTMTLTGCGAIIGGHIVRC